MLNRAHLDNALKGAAAGQPAYLRYAIFYTPQPGTALSAFGRSWFGRANDGATLQAFSDAGLAGANCAKLSTLRGRYSGLHAVFKAPFALRAGMGPDALKARLINFAARRKPVSTGPLTLARSGRSLVLRPIENTPALDWLAAQCVTAFDGFAEAPGDAERADHASLKLSDYQRLLLESFGDPHVLSEFQFSITLTGPLEAPHLERVSQALWPVLEEICAEGVTVDALSLFGDPGGQAPLRLLARHRLGA